MKGLTISDPQVTNLIVVVQQLQFFFDGFDCDPPTIEDDFDPNSCSISALQPDCNHNCAPKAWVGGMLYFQCRVE